MQVSRGARASSHRGISMTWSERPGTVRSPSVMTDVADFLELESAFERDGEVVSAAEVQGIRGLVELLGDGLDAQVLLEDALHFVWNSGQLCEQAEVAF